MARELSDKMTQVIKALCSKKGATGEELQAILGWNFRPHKWHLRDWATRYNMEAFTVEAEGEPTRYMLEAPKKAPRKASAAAKVATPAKRGKKV